MGDSQSWYFWEQGWHCQEPVGMWVVTKPHVTSMCMDMTLQEILESCLACAYFSGQQKQGINALPLSKMRNLNKEVLLNWRLGKILPVDFAAKLLVTQWLIPKLRKQLFLAAIKASQISPGISWAYGIFENCSYVERKFTYILVKQYPEWKS